MPTAVVLEVCGQVFPIPPETIANGPSSRLTRLFKAGWSHEKSERITINRPAECFAAILAFYQTGELHIPMTSCPGAFLNEIEYWEISPKLLSGCCYYRLQSFLDEQETVRTFKSKQKQAVHKFSKTKSQNCFQKCRANIWEIIDYTKPSILGKLYLLLSIAMVLTSIFTLAYSTDPIFRRTMTNCERLEYMVTTGVEGFEIIRPYLQELCGESEVPKFTFELAEKLNRTDIFHLVRDTDGTQDDDFLTFEFITTRVDQSGSDRRPGPETAKTFDTEPIAKHFNKSNIDLIVNNFENITFLGDIANMAIDNDTDILSVNSNLASSVGDKMFPILSLATSPMKHLDIARVTVPNLQTKILTLTILEMITTLFFSVELLLRLSTCPNLKLYFLSIINISDALSLLGTYLYFALYSLYPHLRFGSWIDYLDYCQMLRSLRLFRVVLNIRAGQVLLYSLCGNIKDLFILFFFLFAGVCTFASCIYIVEDNPDIASMPDAWYLAVITMTTVGYGDIHPQTKIGRFVCCLCAVAGILMLALTVPIFANHFLILYSHAESEGVVENYLREKKKVRQEPQRAILNKKEGTSKTQTI